MTLTMENRAARLDDLAGLLGYPGEQHVEFVRGAIARLESWQTGVAKVLAPLAEHVESHALAELEEAYTRTFDISPDCALEIGWHLYGENYTRGAFLVEMRGHMRALGLPESCELPDHLVHVLQVVGRLPEAEGHQLCRDHLLPALSKMRKQLPEDRPHACVFAAVEGVVRELFSIDEELTTGKEALPYFRELDVLPPGFQPPGFQPRSGGTP